MGATYYDGQKVEAAYYNGYATTAYYNGEKVWPKDPIPTLIYETVWSAASNQSAGRWSTPLSSYDTVKVYCKSMDGYPSFHEFNPKSTDAKWCIGVADSFGNGTYTYTDVQRIAFNNTAFSCEQGGYARIKNGGVTGNNVANTRIGVVKVVGVKTAYV